ncbi:MAG: hypothetical protein JST86_13150 [Bacteroidetes bacterium]|nr:hypothetical protein [Bacteroidota bacterium]
MKQFVSIVSFFCALNLFAISLSAQPPKNHSPDTLIPLKLIKFNLCFTGLDTVKATQDVKVRNVTSCTWGTYKLVSKKYILRINPHLFDVKLNKCYEIYIDSVNPSKAIELLVYDSLDAALDNICTDMGDYKHPHYTSKLRPQTGRMYIGFTSPENKVDWPDISVLIKYLVFIHPVTHEKIVFANELIWKCFYDGMPG